MYQPAIDTPLHNLDCFSDSELDSDSDEDERYQYEHCYEMLIWKTLEEPKQFLALQEILSITSFLKTTLPKVISMF